MAIKLASIIRWLGVVFITLLLWIPCTLCGLVDPTGRVAHCHHRIWARLILLAVGARVRVFGLDNLDPQKQYVLASNHEGNCDIPLLISTLPLQFKFAAKRILFRIPIFGWAMWWARYVAIERNAGADKARESLQKLSEKIGEGFSVLMFPEGTRSRSGEIGAFKSGTFRLALQRRTVLLPMAIFGSFRGQSANSWVMQPGNVILHIGREIDPKVVALENPHLSEEELVNELKAICRHRILQLHQEAKVLDLAVESIPARAEAA